MIARVVLVAAYAAVRVSAQFPPPAPDLPEGCTEKSFSIPSWLVQDIKHTADGSISFDVSNRAINYTASLTCSPKGSSWNACLVQGTPASDTTLTASVQVAKSSASFLLNQTWTCNDRGPVVTFTATGSNSATLNTTSPVLVKGSLLAPVAVTPAYAEGPKGHDLPGCTAKSAQPSWVLSAIHLDYEPGDSAYPEQNFHLLLTNPANGYQASCLPPGSLGGASNLSQLTCAGEEFQSSFSGHHVITTQASFDPSTFVFALNQTWFCDDTDAAKPLQINAAGSTHINFTHCTQSHTTEYPNVRSCDVTTDVSLAGRLGTVVTLAPYALDDPLPPRGDGCTLTSLFSPAWEFSSFQVDGGNSSSSSSVSFEIILAAQNRGFQFPIAITQGAAVGQGWYECEIGADGGNDLPLWPYQCRFRYEAAAKELELRAQWACSDLDAAHPVYFSGVTTTILNSTLACETVDGQSQCATADPGYTWDAKITNVTWGSTAPSAQV